MRSWRCTLWAGGYCAAAPAWFAAAAGCAAQAVARAVRSAPVAVGARLQRAVRTGSHSQRAVGSGLAVRRFAATDAALRPAAAAGRTTVGSWGCNGRCGRARRCGDLRSRTSHCGRRCGTRHRGRRCGTRHRGRRREDAPSREAARDAPSREAVPGRAIAGQAAPDAPSREAAPRVGPRLQAVRAFLAPGQTSPRSPQPSKRQEEML